MLAGSISQSWSWKSTLSVQGVNISLKDAIVSIGRSVFMKYLPGKVFSILGRASYISSTYNVSISKTSSSSAVAQIITLIVGTLFSCVLLFNNSIDPEWRLTMVLLLAILILFLFMFNMARGYIYCLGKKLGKRIIVPKIKLNGRFSMVIPFFLNWFFWGLGFLALCNSINIDVNWYAIFIFPVSSVIGIASLLTPGGLGVREGAIGVCLIAIGVPLEEATTISVFSRLWFLIGEFMIFCLAMYLGIKRNELKGVST